MFCTQCGGSLADEAKFCGSCGAPVGPVVTPASDASAPPPFVAPFAAPAPVASVAEQNATGGTFVLNQKLISMTGDLWIDDSNGNHAFEVDGKFLAVRRSLLLKDTSGQELYEINKSLAHVHTTFEVKRGDKVVATIQKALMSFIGEHFTITAADGSQMKVTGNWAGREFHIQKDGTDVIYASRQFFSIHDAYGIQVAPGFDAPLALAIVVALEQVEKEEGHESSPLGGLMGGGGLLGGGGLGGILGG
jgi:uncharacterized protein YxjI